MRTQTSAATTLLGASWVLAMLICLALGWRVSGLDPATLAPDEEDAAVLFAPSSERAAWLATWLPGSALEPAGATGDPGAYLGRPLDQLGGPAFWASHLVSFGTSDPAQHQRRLMGFGLAVLAACGAGCLGGRSWISRAGAGAAACVLPFLLAGVRGGASPAASEVWALASTLCGLWALVRWFGGAGTGWSLFGLVVAVHTVLLSGPATLAHDVVLGLLLSLFVLGWLQRRGIEEGSRADWHLRSSLGPALGAMLFAFISAAPVLVDQARDHGLRHHGAVGAVSEVEALVPMIVPVALASPRAEVDSALGGAAGDREASRSNGGGARDLDVGGRDVQDLRRGHWGLDLDAAKEVSGEVVMDRMVADHLGFRLPRVREDKLLVLPVRYHPKWRASFRGIVADPLCVNDRYLGILVKDRIWKVDVSYVPFSPLVLFSQLGLAGLGILWLLSRLGHWFTVRSQGSNGAAENLSADASPRG